MYGKDLNSRAIEALIMCGALDSFPTNRKQMLHNYDKIMTALSEQNRTNIEGQLDLFGMVEEAKEQSFEMEIPYEEEFDFLELLEMEKRSAGIYISGHPLSNYSTYVCSKVNTIMQIIEGAKENLLNTKTGKK